MPEPTSMDYFIDMMEDVCGWTVALSFDDGEEVHIHQCQELWKKMFEVFQRVQGNRSSFHDISQADKRLLMAGQLRLALEMLDRAE